jgi:hypothetical protein
MKKHNKRKPKRIEVEISAVFWEKLINYDKRISTLEKEIKEWQRVFYIVNTNMQMMDEQYKTRIETLEKQVKELRGALIKS